MLSSTIRKKLDHLGIGVAVLCAIHCALLPVLMAMLPMAGLKFLAHPALELGIILLSLIIALASLGKSWHVHRRRLPGAMVLTGFALILTGHFGVSETYEWMFLTAGSFLVAAAHLVNWRCTKSCTHIK
jgi:hypothetical protein